MGCALQRKKAPAGLREQLAAELAAKGGAAMYEELKQADPEAAAAIHPNNQVRVLRALEHYRATGKNAERTEGGVSPTGAALPQPDPRSGFSQSARYFTAALTCVWTKCWKRAL